MRRMSIASSDPVQRGRPRDPNIEPAVLESTRQLLGEEGFNAATVQEIARRSGTSAPAIYRRWPTRLALIEDAAFSSLTEIAVDATGDLRGDLLRLVEGFHHSLDTPAARAAIPGLIAAYQHEPPPPTQWLKFSVRPQFYEILEAAGANPELDVDEIFDVLHGTLLARIFVPLAAEHAQRLDTFVEMIVRILTPPLPASPRRAQGVRAVTKVGKS
jgi:AcrR family transcriptional regulator